MQLGSRCRDRSFLAFIQKAWSSHGFTRPLAGHLHAWVHAGCIAKVLDWSPTHLYTRSKRIGFRISHVKMAFLPELTVVGWVTRRGKRPGGGNG